MPPRRPRQAHTPDPVAVVCVCVFPTSSGIPLDSARSPCVGELKQQVPLLVVSAGITDIVAETLRLHGLLLDNVTVRGNTMLFGEDDRLERFRESPPVHSRRGQKSLRAVYGVCR